MIYKFNHLKIVGFMILLLSISLYSCKSSKKTISTPHRTVQLDDVPEPIHTDNNTFELGEFMGEYLRLKYPGIDFSKFLYVSVKHQKMYFIINDTIFKTFDVSTAASGVGNKINSLKTPLGLHTIKRKIGDNVPLGGILEARNYNGKQATIFNDKTKADEDYVTSRILWLDGSEVEINKGRNVDSYNRYIYIHGTPEEGYIGEPASHGCIRMRNTEVIELYSLVEEGMPVLILKN